MFKKVLVAEDMDFINLGVQSELSQLGVKEIDCVQYCDEALLKLKSAKLNKIPFDLLISDLSFVQDHNKQKIRSGDQLIKNVRNDFPELKIIVFSVEDKPYIIQTLFNEFNINAYVWKSRNGLRELKKAIQYIEVSDSTFLSPKLSELLPYKNSVEITEYDVLLIECLAQGLLQGQISEKLQTLDWNPSSVSAVEKRLKSLKENFKAKNPAHLVAMSKDLGLI